MTKPNKLFEVILRIATIATVCGLWECLSRFVVTNKVLFPPPSQVILTLIADISTGKIIPDISASIGRVVVGFVFGSIVGVFCGLVTGLNKVGRFTVGQVLHLMRPLPPISIVPLVILWMGTGERSKWFLVAFGSAFPIWISVSYGISRVAWSHIWSARSMGASGVFLIRTVYLPAALPYLSAGLRTGLGVAFFCLVAAEASGVSVGLMYRAEFGHASFRADWSLEALLLLGALCAGCDAVLLLLFRVRWIGRPTVERQRLQYGY